jgi:hypothetical protein
MSWLVRFAECMRSAGRSTGEALMIVNQDDQNGFRFGLETEYLLVDARSFRPLWYPDLSFERLNSALEAIPVDDFQCGSFKVEPPHRKPIPYIVEGYHLPDPDMNPIDLLPKGVEIRTPICSSIDECLAASKRFTRVYNGLCSSSAIRPLQYHSIRQMFILKARKINGGMISGSGPWWRC